MKTNNLTRREFVSTAMAAAAAAPAALAAAPLSGPSKIFMFSKHLQWLDYQAMADTAAKLGLDGLDLTVRPGGHVEPKNVKQDLPRAAEAMRKAGLTIDMMTTGINNPNDKLTADVLSVAADQGFKHYRTGYLRFDLKKPIPQQIEQMKPVFHDLAALNRKSRYFKY